MPESACIKKAGEDKHMDELCWNQTKPAPPVMRKSKQQSPSDTDPARKDINVWMNC